MKLLIKSPDQVENKAVAGSLQAQGNGHTDMETISLSAFYLTGFPGEIPVQGTAWKQ